ncbi:hypothetical protein ACFY0G_34860 [Streptomyces sp. NPDC001552]|uniref:hypothetical protein n=1 Tax=Streptomyces sp. NPDC001552 TaxID=3364587 RepID=UPI0036B72595
MNTLLLIFNLMLGLLASRAHTARAFGEVTLGLALLGAQVPAFVWTAARYSRAVAREQENLA